MLQEVLMDLGGEHALLRAAGWPWLVGRRPEAGVQRRAEAWLISLPAAQDVALERMGQNRGGTLPSR